MSTASAFSMKPFDSMSLDELHAERAQWTKIIESGWGGALEAAIDVRTGIDAMISRRLREIEGEEIRHGKRLPDTPNPKEEAA